MPGFSQKMVEDLKSAGVTLGGKGGEDRGRDEHRSGSHDSNRDSSAKSADHGKDEHRSGSKGGEDRGSSGSGRDESDEDLTSREYTDAQGNVHHHTKTYEEQHRSGTK